MPGIYWRSPPKFPTRGRVSDGQHVTSYGQFSTFNRFSTANTIDFATLNSAAIRRPRTALPCSAELRTHTSILRTEIRHTSGDRHIGEAVTVVREYLFEPLSTGVGCQPGLEPRTLSPCPRGCRADFFLETLQHRECVDEAGVGS